MKNNSSIMILYLTAPRYHNILYMDQHVGWMSSELTPPLTPPLNRMETSQRTLKAPLLALHGRKDADLSSESIHKPIP